MTANQVFPKGRRILRRAAGGHDAWRLRRAGYGASRPARRRRSRTAARPPPPAQPRRSRRRASIRSITVQGNQRLEPETVLSYTALRLGEPYDNERLDQALRDLLATELFADVQIAGADTGDLDHPGARESGHQPHRPRGQPPPQGRQDHAGDPARAAPDLHPLPRPRRRRPHHRALPPPGPLRRQRRAADRPARPEPRRRRLRDQRRAEVAGPPDQHHRQRAVRRRRPASARW